jgi:single-strand DNA-binding protein
MSETITVTGVVATDPRHIITSEGLKITNFRLASAQRKFDRTEGKWVDADTNWYTIASFRQLAANVAASVAKGERVIVTGRLRIREWANDDRKGSSIDVEAEAIGHDLFWGTTTFARNMSATSESSAPSQESEPVPF